MAATLKLPVLGTVTPGYLALSGATLGVFLLACGFLAMLLTGGAAENRRALKESQYARVLIKDGAV